MNLKTLSDCQNELLLCKEDPYEYFQHNNIDNIYRVCHPDKWLNDSELASDIFIKFGMLYDQSKDLKMIGDYRLIKEIAKGDLCDVFYAKRDLDKFVIKTPRVKAKTFIKKEFDVCKLISSEKIVYGKFVPHPVELVGDSIIYEYYDNLISGAEVIGKFGDSLDSRHIVWMFKRTLIILGYIHYKGIVHGAITPDHLLFNKKDHGLKICGWIHSGKEGGKIEVVPSKWKHYYPPSTVKDKMLTKSLDVYMCAKTFLDIGGSNLHKK